jgi:hypothetical protein
VAKARANAAQSGARHSWSSHVNERVILARELADQHALPQRIGNPFFATLRWAESRLEQLARLRARLVQECPSRLFSQAAVGFASIR